MKFKVGDTLDFVGYKGKRTPVQIISTSEVGDHNKEEVVVFTYLDNSGRPNGTCRVSELVTRDQTIKKEPFKMKDNSKTGVSDVKSRGFEKGK